MSPRNYWLLSSYVSPRFLLLTAMCGILLVTGVVRYRSTASTAARTHSESILTQMKAASEIENWEGDLFPDNPGYRGPLVCGDCHHERLAEFRKTKHFLASRKPQAASMPQGFRPGHGHFQSRHLRISFDMIKEMRDKAGEGFFQHATQSTPSGSRTVSSRIDLVYGSAPNDEVYFTWRGDELFELPIAWLHPQQEWGASSFNPDSSDDFARPMSVRCLECHTTWFAHEPGSMNRFQYASGILGVTCERCHGPASEHVDFHRTHPGERNATAILHPGHLSRERLIEVCTQCHGNAIKHRGPAFSYRPGEPLDKSYRTASSRHPEDDHVANQIEYLRESRCFQRSDSMTCITCHNPHRPHDLTSNIQRESIDSCVSCHNVNDCGERSRLPADVQDRCISCHMPSNNKVQVYFDTATEAYLPPVKAWQHRIGIYPLATQEVLWEWHRKQAGEEERSTAQQLSKALVDAWLGEARERRKAYRHLAAIAAYRRILKFDSHPEAESELNESIAEKTSIDDHMFLAARQIREKQYLDAAKSLEAVLKSKPDLAQAHGKLGTVFASLGQREQANEHLEAVTKFDPDDAYGEGMLGWLDYTDGKNRSAAERYRSADTIEPYKAKVHFHWGLALQKDSDFKQAEEHFRLALTIDPRHFQACIALSQVLQHEGQSEEAVRLAFRAAAITKGQQAEILLYLAEILGENDYRVEASQAAEEALAIARKRHPELIPRIQRRLIEFSSN